MNLFGLVVTRAAPAGLQSVPGNKGGWGPLVREAFTGAWQRNIEWTKDSVQAHLAVYACITRIAQDIGKLRPKLVEQDEDGIWSEVTNSAHSPVLRRPNRFQNHIQFKEWWTTSKLTNGNAYAFLERDNRGVVSAMYLLDPTRVQVLVAPDGSVFYRLKQDNISGIEETERTVPASLIVHDRINCLFHPLVGTSPIFACGQAANMGLQIEQNSSAFFGNGSNPSGILSSAVSITPEKSTQLSDIWNARFGRDKSGGVAVLGDGMKFEPMRMTAHDSQLIEQLRWTAESVCSAFHVPPWKIGIGSQPAYTKPEIANQAYYSDCLQSPIEQFELCMDEAFGFDDGTISDGKTLGVELDLDGLLRMDMASQITTLKEAVSGSVLTVNEARRKVDLPPVDGGDSIWMQQQNYSLEALAKRDEKPDPFLTTAPPAPALPAPEPKKQLMAPREEEARSEDSLESWDGWFARDSLTLVREAKELELRAVEDAIEAQERSATVNALTSLTASVASLATREVPASVVNVAAPQVTVNQPPSHLEVHLEPRVGKTVTKDIVLTVDEHGVPTGASVTETTEADAIHD